MTTLHDALGRVDLHFEPSGRRVRVPAGVTLFDAASWNGIAIDSTCGGHGTCKKCKVRVLSGEAAITSLDTRAFVADELRKGWRLACRVEVASDLKVDVPPLETRPKAATVGVGRKVILRPAVQKRHLLLSAPSLSDQTSDIERVLAAMDDLELRVDLYALRRLGKLMRVDHNTSGPDAGVTAVVVDDVLVDIEPGDTTERIFGIAFDLGTTTVVATLLDLVTGTPVAVASKLNPQQTFGADVITRISTIMMDDRALERLTGLAHEVLDELACDVCSEGGVDPSEVYEVAVAGNATMTHIVLGVDPEPLGMAPFVMTARQWPEMLATDVGVRVHPRARAVVFPALGAYVGGDIISGLLASGMDRDPRTRLFIDIGTNCEIVLGSNEGLLATAAPAGPAFEGAAIRCGMRASEGAIEGVSISADEIGLRVIGDAEPIGLCGSGLVDAVAELVAIGLRGSLGTFRRRRGRRSACPRGGGPPHDGRRGARVRAPLARRRRRVHLPVPARRARAAVRQGRHRHRMEPPAGGCRYRGLERAAGAAGRILRQLPVARQRRPSRARAVAAAAPRRERRQRRRRGGEDGAAQPARTRRSHGPAGGGDLCRALGSR